MNNEQLPVSQSIGRRVNSGRPCPYEDGGIERGSSFDSGEIGSSGGSTGGVKPIKSLHGSGESASLSVSGRGVPVSIPLGNEVEAGVGGSTLPQLSVVPAQSVSGLVEPVRRQGVFWICTVPDPSSVCSQLVADGLLPVGIAWFRGQLERGGESGYLHWQFCIAFSKKKSLKSVKTIFGEGIHAELSRSEAAAEYCCKEDTRVAGPYEFGAKPFRRNSARDWEQIWLDAQLGQLSSIPADVRVVSYRTIRAIQSDFSIPLRMDRHVSVYWGLTGTGKSHSAWAEAGEGAYSKCPRSKFWDGYQDQESVVIDEFRGGIDVAHLLRWFDKYPVRVEIKGSSRPFNAKRIFITSNIPPVEWYPDLDEMTMDALLRRLDVHHFEVPFPKRTKL